MYSDTHDLCHVFILFAYDFLSGCTHCGKLCAEIKNVISEQCGVVDCGVDHVALEHLHHVTDVAVVLSHLSLEPQGVQQIAFTDARRDLVDLHMQVAHLICRGDSTIWVVKNLSSPSPCSEGTRWSRGTAQLVNCVVLCVC